MSDDAPSKFFVSDSKDILDREWVCDRLMNHTYWGGWLTRPQIDKAIENSVVIGAYKVSESGRIQVGFLRVVSDFATFSSIMDVYVHEKHRREGIGTRMMHAALNHPACVYTVNVLSSRDAGPFYQKLGYYPMGAHARDPNNVHYGSAPKGN